MKLWIFAYIALLAGCSSSDSLAVLNPPNAKRDNSSTGSSLNTSDGSIVEVVEVCPDTWLDDWTFRRQLVIPSSLVADDLQDFSVFLKRSSDTALASELLSDAADLRFTSEDGQTLLDHELENFDAATGELSSWVRLPQLSSTNDTVFWLYYGNASALDTQNPSAVWDGQYNAVWHLNNDPATSQILDSTANALHGSPLGAMDGSALVAGRTGTALSFDGSDDAVDLGNPDLLQITSAVTLELWFFPRNDIKNDYLFAKNGSNGNRGIDISLDDNSAATNGWVMFRTNTSGWSGDDFNAGFEEVVPDSWHHVVGVFEPSQYARFYLDGLLVSENTSNPPASIYDPAVNAMLATADRTTVEYFDGLIDEVRVSNVARSASWIQSNYTAMNNPNAFVQWGNIETRSPDCVP